MSDESRSLNNPDPDQDPSQQDAWEAMAEEAPEKPQRSWQAMLDWYQERKRQKRKESRLHHELKQRQGRITATSVIRYTKIIAVAALVLSLIYTAVIFLIGMASVEGGQVILSKLPLLKHLVPDASATATTAAATTNGWSTYFLLAFPATLTAVLGITVWVSGLRYAMSFYSDKEPNQQDDSLGTQSLLIEILKKLPPGNSGNP